MLNRLGVLPHRSIIATDSLSSVLTVAHGERARSPTLPELYLATHSLFRRGGRDLQSRTTF